MTPAKPLLVVGSINMDLIIHVDRFPVKDETVCTSDPKTGVHVPGGKGANQAVAIARLLQEDQAAAAPAVYFACQFGNDDHAHHLRQAVQANTRLDLSLAGEKKDFPSGQGLVFLQSDGTASAIVIGGANMAWNKQDAQAIAQDIARYSMVLLQCEIPEEVNEILAKAASEASVPVMLDVGGQDRPISSSLLRALTFISPNLTELQRLTSLPVHDRSQILIAAKTLQQRGPRNVLVTLGERGSILLTHDGLTLSQPSAPVPCTSRTRTSPSTSTHTSAGNGHGQVVDATAAGDAFRAAFAVALTEGKQVQECLEFAAAAGAIAVSRLGAMPSLPYREECVQLQSTILQHREELQSNHGLLHSQDQQLEHGKCRSDDCPFQFASRLNSMKDRLDLWDGQNNVHGWILRQGSIQGLELIDFNYPQHLEGYTVDEIKASLAKAKLQTGAICMRYPKQYQLGAFTNPDHQLRRKAIDLTKEGCDWAKQLGAKELIVWSAFDGYDYSLQVDHQLVWNRIVEAFQEICDSYPDLKISLEFKPTDENTRFFAVPSTGAAVLLVQQIQRSNMGLTLDFGHCLAAGENPAQSASMVANQGMLFGLQLNDGYQRLGAEDGLIFASVHYKMALELVLWLQRANYQGHIYFDTFPRNEDPVREAAYNIRKFKELWKVAKKLTAAGIDHFLKIHDTLGSLELVDSIDKAERS